MPETEETETDEESHPARGAWIEICQVGEALSCKAGRTPQGVRGLKCYKDFIGFRQSLSHPARGAWIEIGTLSINGHKFTSRTPQGVRGLKF